MPRTLTAEQRSRLVTALSTGAGGDVDLCYIAGDTESYSFCVELTGVIAAAGWRPTVNGTLGDYPVGLWIRVQDAQNAPGYAAALQKAFASVGVELQGQVIPNQDKKVRIFVGSKPTSRPN